MMSMKAVVISGVMAALVATTATAQSTAPEQVRGKAGAVKPAAPAGAPVSAKPVQSQPATRKSEVEEGYEETLDIVNQASEIGDEGQAFLLYTDALLKLRKIRGKYPDFKAKEVDAKIKEVNSLLVQLEDAKCQSLEEEKAGRFRFLVWKRQIMILDRIDKLQESTEKNSEILEEIKDKLGI